MPSDDLWCESCNGMGTNQCLCGGDLCICDNYGEYDCPRCDGTGDATMSTGNLWGRNERET